jgi:hypothetical protein
MIAVLIGRRRGHSAAYLGEAAAGNSTAGFNARRHTRRG